MDKVDLPAELRTVVGSRDSRRLRRSGRLPVNLYGHQQEAQSIHVDAKTFGDAMRHHVRVINLQLGGASQSSVIHDLQYDPLSQEVVHVDLLRVDLDEKVEVPVPLKLVGPSKGELEGGVLMELHSEVQVRCLPMGIPEDIEVDVRELNIGQALHVKELPPVEGIEYVGDPELALVTIAEPRFSSGSGGEEGGAEGEEGAKPEEGGGGS